MASSGLKRDSKLKSLEIAIEQKKEECSKLETQLQKVGSHLTRTHVMKFEPPVVSLTNILLMYACCDCSLPLFIHVIAIQ